MLDGHDISTLRTCVSAGEHLPAATWQAWRDATGIAHRRRHRRDRDDAHLHLRRAATTSAPARPARRCPAIVATVLDDDGTADGRRHRPARGQGPDRLPLSRRRAPGAITSQDGWNVTGDTYRQDEDGYFWYVARSDDMIVSSGYNIAAPEVENALYAHPAVAGMRGDRRALPRARAEGEGVRGAGAGPCGRRRHWSPLLQEHVKAAIAPYKYPREIEFVAALPKTATGKLQRFALREVSSPGRPQEDAWPIARLPAPRRNVPLQGGRQVGSTTPMPIILSAVIDGTKK